MPVCQTAAYLCIFQNTNVRNQSSGYAEVCKICIFINDDFPFAVCQPGLKPVRLFQFPVLFQIRFQILKFAVEEGVPGKLVRNTVVFCTEFDEILGVRLPVDAAVGACDFCRRVFVFYDVIEVFPVGEKLFAVAFFNAFVLLSVRLVEWDVDNVFLNSLFFYFPYHFPYFLFIRFHILALIFVRPVGMYVRAVHLNGLSACLQKGVRHLKHIAARMLQPVWRFLHCGIRF